MPSSLVSATAWPWAPAAPTQTADGGLAKYLAHAHRRPVEMGCYGIGVSRVLPAAVECFHDAHGIRWPAAIAPYRACIVTGPSGSPGQQLLRF